MSFDAAGGTATAPGVRVQVPPQAVAAGSKVHVVIRQSVGAHGEEIFGEPIEVEHDKPLLAPLRLEWSLAALTTEQRHSLILTRWNATSRVWGWTSEPITIVGDTLITEVQQFSVLDWIANAGQWVGERAGTRADAPSCNGKALPSWVRGVVDPDENLSAAAIRVCFEPDRDEKVTVRLTNNRVFSQRLKMTSGDQNWAWTWPGTQTYGASALVYLVARAVFDSPNSYLVPPLTEIAVGVDRPNTPGQLVITATSYVEPVTVLVDVATYALDHLHIDINTNPLASAFLQALLECGGKAIADWPTTDGAEGVARAVVGAVGSCASELVRPESAFGARYESLVQQTIRSTPLAADVLARSNRLIHEIAGKFALLEAGAILFYLSDQLANALVGPLLWSIRGNGRPQALGAWTPTCNITATDSNLLYRNLALQDQFTDTSKDLWQFPGWDAAAKTAVTPLAGCPKTYLTTLAAFLPGSWGDRKAATVVASHITALVTNPPVQTPGGGTPPGSGTGSQYSGRVIRVSATGTTYWVDFGGTRHWIPDGETFYCMVARYGQAVDGLTQAQANAMPEGAQASRCLDPNRMEGKVIRARPSGDAWLVSGGVRRPVGWVGVSGTDPFVRDETVYCLAAQGRTLVDNLTQEQAESLPGGTIGPACLDPNRFKNKILRNSTTGESHFVDSSGARRWIQDGETYYCLTGRGYPVVNISYGFVIETIPAGSSYPRCLDPNRFKNTIIVVDATNTSYFVDGSGTLRWIPDANVFACLSANYPVRRGFLQEQANSLGNGQPWATC